MKSLMKEESCDFINTTYDISLDSRTSRRCSKRILSGSSVDNLLDGKKIEKMNQNLWNIVR